MPYELSVFRHLLQEDLSPLYFPTESPLQTTWYEQHLSITPTFATKQVHAQFEATNGTLPGIRSLRIRLLDQHPLPAFVAQDHTVYPYEAIDGDALLSRVLAELSLDPEAVIDWYHWQDERGQLHLELYARYPLGTLTTEERRYFFYQRLLTEQVTAVQEHTVRHVHQTTSRKKARKYVQDYQRDLLTYASQALHYLDEEQPNVYTQPEDYTLPDIFRLIFLSLEELLDFLQQQFTQYLDTDALVSYHHQIVNVSQLKQRWQTVQEKLKVLPIDKELLTLLEEAFASLQRLPAQPVKHEPLNYDHRLLPTLETFVAQTDPTEEALVAALFRINFNHPSFVAWFADQIQEGLTVGTTAEERLLTLYRYRKFVKQLAVDASESYQPSLPSAYKQVLTWIDEEISYQRQVGDVSAVTTKDSLPRIKTNFSVPELSLLIRTLFEVEVLVNQKKKAHVYQHFSRILESVEKEDISYKTLRERQYRPDRHTIAAVKDKVIAMMNFLNKLE